MSRQRGGSDVRAWRHDAQDTEGNDDLSADAAAYRQAKNEMAQTGEQPVPWLEVKRALGLSSKAGRKNAKPATRRAPREK